MRFQREEPSDPATTAGISVQISPIAIGLNADITKVKIGQYAATAINEGCVSGPVY